MKVGFFHHGTKPSEADAKALAGMKVIGRNANNFRPSEIERFDIVLVDQGTNTNAINEAYGDKVTSIDKFVEQKPEPAAEAKTFNPDEKPAKPKAKPQGK